jgi:hypothetical protein
MNNFELTLDQLVFHAIYLFHIAYCNSDLKGKKCYGKEFITPAWVMDKATDIYYQSEDEIKHLIKDELKKDESQCAFLVNRQTAASRGVSVFHLLGEARRQYSQFLWKPRIEILMPYIQKAYSNSRLAKILERETGEVFDAKTIGTHVAPLREYRVKQAGKSLEERANVPKKGTEVPVNEQFERKICGDFAVIYENNNFSSVPVPPVADLLCSASFTPRSSIMGGILSTTHQIAVANSAKKRDADWRRKRFGKLYLQHRSLPDKERKEIIKKEMGISDRTYYYNKKECEEELDRLYTCVSERATEK